MTHNDAGNIVQRSWWNRKVPVSIRHNIRLILGSIVVLSLVGVLLGSFQIRPIVFSEGEMLPTITNNIAGSVDLFDRSVPHTIALEVSDIAYDRMISDFKRFNEKTIVEADAIIDGTFIGSVGIRLKGNSTLFGISGRRPPPPAANDGPPGEAPPEGAESAAGGPGETPPEAEADDRPPYPPEGAPYPPETADNSAPAEPPPDPIMIRMRSMMGGATEDDPSTLPLLLSFNEFMPGRGYQGQTELSIRPVSGGGASLNEALSLQLIRDSDQITQQFTWVTFSVNGEKTATRLVIENPNQDYTASLGLGRGVLYKSRNTNAFEYIGDDASLYVEDIAQVSAIGMQDLSPVIRLLAWLDSATDEEFDRDFSNWVDVPSFAKYVVTQDLMDNFDDMAGPGRNFLLWYDLNVKQFTVITWDMNLVLVGLGDAFRARLTGGAPDGAAPPADTENTAQPIQTNESNETKEANETELVAATEAGDGTEADNEATPPGPPAGAPPGSGGRDLTFGNILKDRFEASEVFSKDIANARAELLEFWFRSGLAVERLNELAPIVPITDSLTAEQIATQVAELTEFVSNIE